MVKLGFIGEGDTEKNILESTTFRQFLDGLGLDYIENVINAKGGGNLIPDKLMPLVQKKYFCEFPEDIERAFDFIKKEAIRLNGRGFSKMFLCKRMLKSGFFIQNAAEHPNCASAAYFVKQLEKLSDNKQP